MSKTGHVGFKVLAETGAMRRAIERVEQCALELEQAIADLNRMQVGLVIEEVAPTPDALPGARLADVSVREPGLTAAEAVAALRRKVAEELP